MLSLYEIAVSRAPALFSPSSFSISSVMADLEVLAQQQRESQRKLEMTKAIKQQKLQQRSALENRLADLKYSNGQKRAQLLRARDVLSSSTRQLGQAKLLAGKAGDNLKGFDERLKRALLTNRNLQAARRKVDSMLLVLRNKVSTASRLKAEAEEKVATAQKERDAVRQEQESLRRGIQENNQRASQLVEETANVRSDILGLEQELATAKQLEASAKLRVDDALAEKEAEDKRHGHAVQAIKDELKQIQKQQADMKAQAKAIEDESERKNVELAGLWTRYITYQKDAGLEVSPNPPQEEMPLPTLNLESLRAQEDATEAALLNKRAIRDDLRAKENEHGQELARLEVETAAVKEDAKKTHEATLSVQGAESKRREANEATLNTLNKEKIEVEELRRAVSELQSKSDQEKRHIEEQLELKTKEAEMIQLQLHEEKGSIEAEEKTVASLKDEIERNAKAIAERIARAEETFADAKAATDEMRKEAKSISDRLASETRDTLEDLRQAHSIMKEEDREQLAQLLKGKICMCVRSVFVI
jgi:chromosome segregation ATPase